MGTGKCSGIVYGPAAGVIDDVFGIVGSVNINPGTSNAVHNEGIQAVDRITGGMIEAGVSVDFRPVEDDFISTYIRRAETGFPCSELTEFDVYVEADLIRYKLLNCKTNSITFSCGGLEEALTCSADIMALTASEIAYVTPVSNAITTDPFMGNFIVATLETVEYSVQDFTIELNNNLEYLRGMDAQSTNDWRFYDSILENAESLTVSFSTLTPITALVRGNLADTIITNLTFNALCTRGGDTLELEVDGMANSKGEFSVETDGVVKYNYSFEIQKNTFANFAATYTPAPP